MHEGRRDEHAGAEVAGEEERVVGHWEAGEAADDDGEGAGGCAEGEDEEEGEDVEGGVVGVVGFGGAAGGAGGVGRVILLTAVEFGLEDAQGDGGPVGRLCCGRVVSCCVALLL